MRVRAFIVVLVMLCASLAVRAQEPDETIRIDTNLISVPVIVSDRSDRYVSGLRIENFKLYDNEVEQKISFFDAAQEPLNVVLLLDTSRSTYGVLGEIKNAAREFLNELRPQDRAMIISFDADIHKLSPLTSDRKLLQTGIKHAAVSKYFGTLLNDTVMETSKTVLQPVTGRKAIILLTDGRDGGSRIGAGELLAYESEADAMIYSIYYESSFRTGLLWRRKRQRDAGAIDFLKKLSDVTGGYFYSSKSTNLKQAFDLAAKELRSQYRLGFYPEKVAQDGSLRALKVRVDRVDVSVRSRRQYRTKPPS